MPTSYILYIVLFTISIIGFCCNTNKFRVFSIANKHINPKSLSTPTYLWLILVGIIGIIICILKPDFLPDVTVYKSYFYNKEFTYVENSYKYLSEISPNFIILIAIYAVLSISIKLYAIKRTLSKCLDISMLLSLSSFCSS